ncbi:hypothetical protein A4D02_20800 [Niastella koreensis]|uniref:LVIVD repeat protein n=2 Tax=Niastella koreensis TaxID=354356 RepID=G8TLN9_NIAKG|nr:LVIVD repeat-containing protein [Niastella koreensis]AEV96608.1 LVIVD repeat protein [Niastella koreensis GR20-10]OQP54120.1 hypothetical protein A4D02_20800 [Niastella koreensis]
MKQPTLIAVGIGLCLCLCRCYRNNDGRNAEKMAYVPVYMAVSDKTDISISTVRPTERSGKIYAFGNYIYQNDLNKGIHIIDNSDPQHPQKIAFLNIPYNTEFAVKGNYIYANNGSDLVVVDIRDIMKPVVVKRMADAFPYVNQDVPPQAGYFVCPDPGKGIVVDWVLQNVKSPNCKH